MTDALGKRTLRYVLRTRRHLPHRSWAHKTPARNLPAFVLITSCPRLTPVNATDVFPSRQVQEEGKET